MGYPISACVFIRNNSVGFCLFESMASWMPFVDEFIIMDLGSTDGTFEILKEIEESNSKVKVIQGSFYKQDAGIFADLANDLIAMCKNDTVLYYQADEIPHQNLLRLLDKKLQDGKKSLSFWRIQYRENFQKTKWLPHIVHRIEQKNKFHFVGDGMNTQEVFGVDVCSMYNAGWFSKWGEIHKEKGDIEINKYVDQMITDVSMVGAFRDNIPDRRTLHAPLWHENTDIEGVPIPQWIERELQNPNWIKTESPFNIPAILKYHIGKTRYVLRTELLDALKADETEDLIYD